MFVGMCDPRYYGNHRCFRSDWSVLVLLVVFRQCGFSLVIWKNEGLLWFLLWNRTGMCVFFFLNVWPCLRKSSNCSQSTLAVFVYWKAKDTFGYVCVRLCTQWKGSNAFLLPDRNLKYLEEFFRKYLLCSHYFLKSLISIAFLIRAYSNQS